MTAQTQAAIPVVAAMDGQPVMIQIMWTHLPTGKNGFSFIFFCNFDSSSSLSLNTLLDMMSSEWSVEALVLF